MKRNVSLHNSWVEKAVKIYTNHPSILKINDDFIDTSKSYQKNNIPPKILKENYDICTIVLSSYVNHCIEKGIFPNNLKNADITPTFKKGDRLLKSDYRPVSILPTLSKIYTNLHKCTHTLIINSPNMWF